ncbi:protein of unknown function [Candidatus Nitrosotalea okcheonensis]|uniref:Uncharacterized protein n=1 Tax=Candidatus Nitrosotalea okcheonensis TaxID=1903276 RepID=A0A2H1FEV9_9ARCH|nr:protein of unknown function [Candidatus Nitrosotalea okcheonensis]
MIPVKLQKIIHKIDLKPKRRRDIA